MTKILVLEDDDLSRQPLIDLLEASGYTVLTADNGREGIEIAQRERPDLIISDIVMPEVDGFGVYTTLQDEPETAIIPFIFLTAKSDPADIREGLGLGADDYLIKPFQPAELLEAVRVRLEKYARLSRTAAQAEVVEYDQIFIKDGDHCWFVEYERLRLLESEDNYVRMFFDDEKPLISRTLNYLEKRLPAKHFFRANRKQIVNLKWIKGIQPWFNGGLLLALKDGTKVQMSRRAAQTFKTRLGI